MYQPTYLTPGPFIHCFVMFVPFLLTPGFLAKGFGVRTAAHTAGQPIATMTPCFRILPRPSAADLSFPYRSVHGFGGYAQP